MPDAVWTALIGPAAVLLLGFIVSDMVRPMITKKRAGDTTPAPVVGDTIPADPAEPWRLAHDNLAAERDRILEDLRCERDEHDQCHDLMRGHGLTPPHN